MSEIKECCKKQRFNPYYEKEGLHVCATCGKIIGYYCKGCDQAYSDNHLILHDDVYVCKICGQTQWGYTEYMK